MSDDYKTDPIVSRMLRRYELAQDADRHNRDQALNSFKFALGGANQWTTEIYEARGNSGQSRESYNQIPQFVHQVTNDMRMNMAQTRFVPGDDGDKETAEVMEDLVRNIQSSSEAEVAFDMAAQSQVIGGWGYWRYYTEYESDKGFDQIIKIAPIPNPFSVYDDPSCLSPDKLDRNWLIQVTDQPVKDFNDDNDRDYDSAQLEAIGDRAPDWASGDEKSGIIRVAEYWERKTSETKKLYRKKNKDGSFGESQDEKPKGEYDERDVPVYKITWYKCTADEVLEKKEWQGIYIPYIFVAGETTTINGKTYLKGIVDNMIPAQILTNYAMNSTIELFNNAPKSPWLIDPVQIEGYQGYWDQANVNNYSYLPYRRMVNSQDYGQPVRAQNSADLGSAVSLLQMAKESFYSLTGIYPANLGQSSNEKSGKAILARQKEGDVSTFHFPDNMARAQRAGGRILLDLIPKIYDGARSITGIKEDKTHKVYRVNEEYRDEDKDEIIEHDLTKGTYDVMVTTGPSFTTRRQEASDAMLQLASSTNLMDIAPDIVYGTQDWPGSDEIAQRYKKTLPPALVDDKKNQIPPQVEAQMQQMQQIIQQGAQEIQQLQQEVDSNRADIAKSQAEIQLKAQQMQLNAADSERQAQLDAARLQLDAKKQETEDLKVQLQAAQLQMQHIEKTQAPQVANDNEDDMGYSVETLQQMMADTQAKQAQKEQEMANQQMMAQQQQEMQMQKEAEEQMKSQALMDNLMAIQGSIMQLTASISAPKQIVRDPATGLVSGVVNV